MGYGELKPEASLETHPDSSRPHPDWPNKGHVELTEVTYRHFPEGPLVLKGISATILPSEKVCFFYNIVSGFNKIFVCIDWDSW